MARAEETTVKRSAFSNAVRIGVAVGAVQAVRSNTVRSTVRSGVSKTFGRMRKAIFAGGGSAGSESWSASDNKKGARTSGNLDERTMADCLECAEGHAVTEQFNAATDGILHS